MLRHRKKFIDAWSAIVIFSLIALDGVIWRGIIFSGAGHPAAPGIYFLDVPQGESALTVLPDGVTIMTDAGPNNDAAASALQKILPSGDASYIDLAVISYPQSDHYGGYAYLLDHYRVGAFLYNGRNDIDDNGDWQALVAKITSKHIPLITIGVGDTIHDGNNVITILSPDKNFVRSASPGDTAIVQYVATPAFAVLLASDIGVNVEDDLLASHTNLHADILKAPFPGLSTTAGDNFLRAIDPSIIVVPTGVKNTPSAPSKAALQWLTSSTRAAVVNIAQSGTIGIFPDNGHFLLYNK